MKVKNILFIEGNLDGTIGGSHYCLLEIVKRINRGKFRPLVIFYQENSLIPEFKKVCQVIINDRTRGFVVKRDLPGLYVFIEKRRFLQHLILFYQKTYNFLRYFLTNFLRILYFLLKFKIDIVHLNNVPALTDWLIGSKVLGVKCLAHLRGNWEPNTLQTKLVKYYDKVISISDSVTSYVKRKVSCTNKFITIHDGIDINSVFKMRKRNTKEVRDELKISQSGNLVGVVGNIKDWKGQHVAIEATKVLKKNYPDIKCLIIGDISNLKEDQEYFTFLRKIVEGYGLNHNVIFTGFREDIPDIICALDVLLHTSVAPEPLGRVILEGMVFSKSVIATAYGGPLEIIEDGISGFLVPPNDPIALAEKIDYLLSNPDIRKKIGEKGRRRVQEHFSIETNVKKIEELYTQLTGIK